jgi:hypothetical protein
MDPATDLVTASLAVSHEASSATSRVMARVPRSSTVRRIHPVRVALVDLEGGKVVLRARHGVDPSWVSAP